MSQFVELVDTALGSFEGISVEGEVSEYKLNQGKWVLFKLKDENARVDCFMPKWDLKTQIEDGMMIRAVGRPRLKNWGQFSFNLTDVQPIGEGALKRAYELLLKKLTAEGLFAPDRKRALRRWPERVVLITSRDAAAYSDFLTILEGRQGGLDISFIHTLVQGEAAPMSIIDALQTANTELRNMDAVILIRGGGSIEDLQAFNDERVVRAVAGSRIPTMVGIGHERDVTLAELAADVRASTPSNAAELLVQTRAEIIGEIDQMKLKLKGIWQAGIHNQTAKVRRLVSILQGAINNTYQQVNQQVSSLKGVGIRLTHKVEQQRIQIGKNGQVMERKFSGDLINTAKRLSDMKRLIYTLSPRHLLERGYSITRNEAGEIIKSGASLSRGDIIRTRFSDEAVLSRVEDREKTS